MLTLLSTVKARLAIDEFELKYDPLLTSAIKAVSVRFDKETDRTLSQACSHSPMSTGATTKPDANETRN